MNHCIVLYLITLQPTIHDHTSTWLYQFDELVNIKLSFIALIECKNLSVLI